MGGRPPPGAFTIPPALRAVDDLPEIKPILSLLWRSLWTALRQLHPSATSSADKVLGSSSGGQNLCPSSPRGEAAFELSFHYSDNSAATLEAALYETVTSALATTWRCAVPSGYRLRQ